MKKVIMYNFWLQNDKDSVFSIERLGRSSTKIVRGPRFEKKKIGFE